jgi:hypothetical protein
MRRKVVFQNARPLPLFRTSLWRSLSQRNRSHRSLRPLLSHSVVLMPRPLAVSFDQRLQWQLALDPFQALLRLLLRQDQVRLS